MNLTWNLASTKTGLNPQNSAHKRSRDGAFGRYMITEHKDILFASGRLTYFVFLVSQRLVKGHTRASDLEPRLDRDRA